ncbi:MAG: glycosyltransferase family 4 protein [Chloroflexaceae bacterium]|nr:glycosyltransferase family 4 protein [Chloroflexaceae bacterium]
MLKKIAVYLFSYDGVMTWCCGVGTMTRHFIYSMPVVADLLRSQGVELVFSVGSPFLVEACPIYRADLLARTQKICQDLSGKLLFHWNGTDGTTQYINLEQWQASCFGAASIILNEFQTHGTNIIFTTDTVYCGVSSAVLQQLSHYQGQKPTLVWMPHATGLIHEAKPDRNRFAWESQPILDAKNYAECFVTYINNFMKNHLIQGYGAAPNRLIPLFNGLPLFEELVTPDPLAIREKYGLPQEREFILATGRAETYKGFLYLVRAFAQSQTHHEAELVLILSLMTLGGEATYREIRKEFEALKVRGQIICNFIPQEELRAIFRLPNLKSVVVPSLKEPFGLIPIELRYWCNEQAPVLICSNVGGLTELITHDRDGFLVDVKNTAEFAGILTKAIQLSPQEKQAFLHRGKQELAQKWNLPNNIASAILQICDRHQPAYP